MKKSDTCPKCNSKDIVQIPGWGNGPRFWNYIRAGWTIFSIVPVTRYLCSNCGFSEEWIDDPQDIKMLKEKFKKKAK